MVDAHLLVGELMNNLRITFSLVFAVAVLTSYGVGTAETQKMRVGFIGALSGPAGVYGIAARNGIELALEDLGEELALTIIYEDDAFKPSRTISGFRKLVDVDKVSVVLSLASQPSNSIAPLAESGKIPLLAWASDPKVSKSRDYVIRTYPSGLEEGQVIAKLALGDGLTRAALLYQQNDYPISVAEGVRDSLSKTQIVFSEPVEPEVNDFRTLLPRIRASNPDWLFLCLNLGLNALVSKQLKEQKIEVPIIGCENLNSVDEANLAHGALDEARFVTIGVNPQFQKRYLA